MAEAHAPLPPDRLVLLRLSGDIGTKARGTRQRFADRLVQNLRDALVSEGIEPRIRARRERLFVESPAPGALEIASRVFGVQSLSLVERRPGASLDAIVRAGAERFRAAVAGRRFAVRARCVGDRGARAFSTRDIERALGEALRPASAGVDLTQPEITVRVEVFEGDAYFFTDVQRAHGGLPIGVEGRAVALASGGFDSAVAAWMMLRRGVALDYVFCNLGGDTHLHGVLRVLKVLADRWSYGSRPRLHVVDFQPLSEHLQERAARRYWQVLLKRLMVRAAESIARPRRGLAIVTGEAVGQVSSQTLQNLSVISRAAGLPILRPLVGFNKEEIIERSQAIGTYALSAVVGEYCAIVPKRPATAAAHAAVRGEEANLDLGLLERAVEARAELDLRAVDLDKLELPEIEIQHVPEGATVLDVRSRAEYRSWHYPDALQLDFAQALKAYPSFDRAQTYVLYCEFGLKSAHLAELMRREGLEAFNFKGGVKALRRYAPS
ncbi:MAG: tRNA 4-thiouridine(8) synthase ThiI [Deltaproteobacteria bacterium]|nr:MAG: tRNA 4-thiouridine(8) synthase ThiI [Deltaproteobacteria bacterium]